MRYLGPPDIEGKKKYVYETCHGSKREAEQLLRQRIGTIETGTFVEKTDGTIGQFLQSWLEEMHLHRFFKLELCVF